MSLFDENVSCEESQDCLDWVEAYRHSRQIGRLLDDTSENPLLAQLDHVCSETMGIDEIVGINEKGKIVTRFNPIMRKTAIADDVAADVVNHNAECELRNNLFGKMLGNLANGGKMLSPEQFDNCFKKVS
jgi:hypothetical protein